MLEQRLMNMKIGFTEYSQGKQLINAQFIKIGEEKYRIDVVKKLMERLTK